MNLYEDVRRCCLTRPTIQRHINEPAFWEVAIGCLVRVRVEDGQQITYQIGQIVGVEDQAPVTLEASLQQTNKVLNLLFRCEPSSRSRHLGTSRSSTTVLGSYTGKHPLTQISSEQISRPEYQDWLHVLSRSRTPAPIIDPNKPALLVRFFDRANNNIENAMDQDDLSDDEESDSSNRRQTIFFAGPRLVAPATLSAQLRDRNFRRQINVGMAEVESFQDLSIAEIRVCLGELIFDGDKTNENLAKMSRHPISVGNGIMLSWKSYVKPIPAFLARYGLIPNSVLCPECKHLMTLEYCTDSVGGVVWVCSSSTITRRDHRRPLLDGSFFNGIPRDNDLITTLSVILSWCQGGEAAFLSWCQGGEAAFLSGSRYELLFTEVSKRYLSAFFAPHQLETMSAGEMSHYFRLKAKDGGQPSSSSIFARFIETLHDSDCHTIGPDGLFCAPTREKELISAATASQQGKRIAKAVNKVHGVYEEAHRTMNYLSPNAPKRQQIGSAARRLPSAAASSSAVNAELPPTPLMDKSYCNLPASFLRQRDFELPDAFLTPPHKVVAPTIIRGSPQPPPPVFSSILNHATLNGRGRTLTKRSQLSIDNSQLAKVTARKKPNKPPPAKKAFLSSASASNENMASTKPLVMTVDMPLKKKKSMGKCRLWTRGSSIKKFKKKANAAAAVIAVAKAVSNTEEAGPSNKTSSSSPAFLDRRQGDSLMEVDKEKGRRRSLIKIIKKDKIGTAKKRTQTARKTTKGANGGGRMPQLAKWSMKTIKRQVSMDKQEQPQGELKGQEHGEQRTGRVEGRKPQQDYEAKLLATNGFLRFQILL